MPYCVCVFLELRRRWGYLWEGGASSALLLDEDQGWLLVGGRDQVHLLSPDSPELPARRVRRVTPTSCHMTLQGREKGGGGATTGSDRVCVCVSRCSGLQLRSRWSAACWPGGACR